MRLWIIRCPRCGREYEPVDVGRLCKHCGGKIELVEWMRA